MLDLLVWFFASFGRPDGFDDAYGDAMDARVLYGLCVCARAFFTTILVILAAVVVGLVYSFFGRCCVWVDFETHASNLDFDV